MNKTALAPLFVVALCAPALAQSSRADRAYCDKLSEIYVTYLGHDLASSARLSTRGTAEGQTAVAQCHMGDAADSIPTLERILRNNGFTLPKRG
jgi:hypothetical protein